MTTVLKLGGELALPERQEELRIVAHDLAALVRRGERVVVVHGGGPQVSALSRARGLEPRLVDGRRVTDERTLEVLLHAVGGEVNFRIASALSATGLRAVGCSGASAHCVLCEKQPPRPSVAAGAAPVDYGWVGDVTRVDRDFLEALLSAAMVPVMACIGVDRRGSPLNVNADAFAAAVAGALAADRLLLLTGVPGVLGDPSDPSTRLARLDWAEAKAAVERGAVQGGMVAKLEEAFAALEAGVKAVHVLGRLGPGDLLRAIDQPGDLGTRIEGGS